MANGHLHLLARNGRDLTGEGHPSTREDIEQHLNGTPYRDEPALWAVVIGDAERGVVVVEAGWVAVVRCQGAAPAACAEVLTSAAISADIQALRQGH